MPSPAVAPRTGGWAFQGVSGIAGSWVQPDALHAVSMAQGPVVTADCGKHWTVLSPPSWTGGWHGSIRSIYAIPLGSIILVGHGGGVLYSEDRGATWAIGLDPGGLGSAILDEVGVSYLRPGLLLGTYSTRPRFARPGGAISEDGGRTWRRIEHWRSWLWFVFGQDDRTVYAVADTRLLRVRIGEEGAEEVAAWPVQVGALGTSADARTLWVGLADGTVQYSDDLTTWTSIGGAQTGQPIVVITPHPTHTGAVYLLDDLGHIFLYVRPESLPPIP